MFLSAEIVTKNSLYIPEVHEIPSFEMFQITKNVSPNNALLLILLELQ